MRPLVITRDLQLALAIYTIGVERSRRAYHADQTAELHAIAAREARARARATCKAAAQQRYRDRQKEKT